jgi:hypothetical protein
MSSPITASSFGAGNVEALAAGVGKHRGMRCEELSEDRRGHSEAIASYAAQKRNCDAYPERCSADNLAHINSMLAAEQAQFDDNVKEACRLMCSYTSATSCAEAGFKYGG